MLHTLMHLISSGSVNWWSVNPNIPQEDDSGLSQLGYHVIFKCSHFKNFQKQCILVRLEGSTFSSFSVIQMH